MTQALELGTVTTSNNKEQRHRQLQWAESKPSLIMMDAINAIIVKHLSAHKMSAPLTQQGELWQSASEPQGGLNDEHNKDVMKTL
jgi:hypothetical protein